MTSRVRSVLVAFFVALALPVYAQGQGQGGPPSNSLAGQLQALTARVAKLEGNITAADLAGTYNFLILDTQMTGVHPPDGVATIRTSGERATLTLNANGTGSASGLSCGGSRLTVATGALTDAGGDEDLDCSKSGATVDVTWTYAGGVITITFVDDGDQIPFSVALGGRLLIVGGASFFQCCGGSEESLFIATRLQ
jgi:hypothetical protein